MTTKTKTPPRKVHDLDTTVDPWERQPKEPEAAWQSFKTWRDAGEERSIRKVAEDADRWFSVVQNWSAAWRWKERVTAFDRHLDKERVKEATKAVREMARRHASLSNAALGVLQEPIKELVARITDGRMNLKLITDRDLLGFVRASATAVKELVAVERVARGTFSDVVGNVGATVPHKTAVEALDDMLREAGFDVGSATPTDPSNTSAP